MPYYAYYKHRKIELTPRRHDDGTWNCPYRVIEFTSTSWVFYKGCAEGRFASRGEAAVAALEEAKRSIDAREAPADRLWAKLGRVLCACGTRIKKILGLVLTSHTAKKRRSRRSPHVSEH
jgi:hypothetical protein